MFDRKYRPSKFEEFIGNKPIVRSLLQSYPDWPSSFLFAGPPGIGKTTLARLIAKQLKCTPKEIDAGQDRGIDNIRGLIESTRFKSLVSNYKVYIIDECQGLTKDAQQALLKITEEPPKNTYFILCSTDPSKIIKALRSRCQNYNLEKLSRKELGLIIKNICDNEGIDLKEKKEIATFCIDYAEGIPRTAIKLFEKLRNYTVEEAKKEIGEYEDHDLIDLVKALENKDIPEFYTLLKEHKNYESVRIAIGHILKGKIINLIKRNKDWTVYYNTLGCFIHPVDNINGDIELIHRILNALRSDSRQNQKS